MNPAGRARIRKIVRGFTLVELLVVISLFVLVLAIGVPAFAALLRSNERASAESSLSLGIRAARDIAQRGEGLDGAVVFTFENGITRLIPCVMVTQVVDLSADGAGTVKRDVFVPHPLYKAAQLPRGWTVRGYARAYMIDNEWYSQDSAYGTNVNSGPVAQERQRGNWVFPQTSFFDVEAQRDGDQSGAGRTLRHTFMVRFSAITGQQYADPAPALVIVPRASEKNRPSATSDLWKRVDRADDLRRWALRVAADPSLTLQARSELIGDRSADTVMAKNVNQLALVDEAAMVSDLNSSKLLGSTRVTLDRTTQSLYLAYGPSALTPTLVSGSTSKDIARAINQVIENREIAEQDIDGDSTTSPFKPQTQVFVVNPLRGRLVEVTQ